MKKDENKEAVSTFASDLENVLKTGIKYQEEKIEKAEKCRDFTEVLVRKGRIEALNFVISKVNTKGLQAYFLYKQEEEKGELG